MDKKYRDLQYFKFCIYGFLKNLKFFDVFFLIFLRETGLSYLQIGVLYSFRQITINVLEIPSGLVADILGRKNALIFGFFAYLLSFFIFYTSDSYRFFILAVIAFGTGEAFRSGTHKAMILDYLRIKDLQGIKTRYYGGTRSWSQFGSAVSSLIAMALVLWTQDYRNLFLFSALPYALDLINLITYPAYLNGVRTNLKSADWKHELKKMTRDTWREFIAMFRSGRMLHAMFSASSYIAVFKFAKDYLQPILEMTILSLPLLLNYEDQERTAIAIGLVYFFIFLLTSWASRNAWHIEEKLKSLPFAINITYLAGIGALCISGVLLSFNWQVAAVVFFIGLYFFQNVRRTLIISYLSDLIGSNVMASGLSAESQLQTILIVIFAPLLGWIADSFGLSFGLIIIGLLFIMLYPLLRIRPH